MTLDTTTSTRSKSVKGVSKTVVTQFEMGYQRIQ